MCYNRIVSIQYHIIDCVKVFLLVYGLGHLDCQLVVDSVAGIVTSCKTLLTP